MPNLDGILTRADVPTLETLIGRNAVDLLRLLDPRLIRAETLRSILLGLRGPGELLSSRASWQEIVDLLSEEEAAELCTICGISSDMRPWASLRSLNLRQGTRRARCVGDFFTVDLSTEEQTSPSLPSTTVIPGYALFGHQRMASSRVMEELSSGDRRVVLHMPTGSGKTRTAMHVICDHLKGQNEGVALWLAYSEELCEQAATEFEKAWQFLGDRSLEVLRYWGRHDPNPLDTRDGLIVAGLGKCYSRVIRDIQFGARLGEHLSLIIIDEAHQAIAPTYKLLLESLQAKNRDSAILGLTATPGRTWDRIDEDRELASFFANRKVMLAVPGYRNPVTYLTDKGYLAKATFRDLLYEAGYVPSRKDIERIESELDIPASVLHSLGEDEQRNLAIICDCETMAHRHTRIIVFAPSVASARLITTALNAHGKVPARCITGDTPNIDRQRNIEWYLGDSPEPRIICNYGVLTAGFDAPRTSAVMIARPTKSLVLYSQMVGRAIRGPRAEGNAHAEIVTVLDRELPGFRSLEESFTNWEDAGWDTR